LDLRGGAGEDIPAETRGYNEFDRMNTMGWIRGWLLAGLVIGVPVPLAFAQIPAALSTADWEILVESPVRVQCAHSDGMPWCQAIGDLDVPLHLLEQRVTDLAQYPNTFLRIRSARILAPDIVHISLDMPYFLEDRDYVARFVRQEIGAALDFSWRAVEHARAPVGEAVRLPRAAGSWLLEPLSPGRTRVTYSWNGELLGDFPDFALSRAWTVQGLEVLKWLEAGPQ
jgi:hypothetical protein